MDRLTGHAHTLILDGPSYRQRPHTPAPGRLDPGSDRTHDQAAPQWVPSPWQTGGPLTLASDIDAPESLRPLVPLAGCLGVEARGVTFDTGRSSRKGVQEFGGASSSSNLGRWDLSAFPAASHD